uniref:Inner mitochondrial membrane peptidase subunit 1 n=1 Tax=Calidris pygmaea TaxID=425635 RepID=A0A8C3K8Z5_9CHAR
QAALGKGEGQAEDGGGGEESEGGVPGPAPHQPSTQSREGSPLESSSCPCRTEGRVPATAASRLPAAAFRWKLVAPRPRAAPPTAGPAAAAISAARGLTGARGRREEASPFLSTNGRAAWETRYPMGGRVLCTSRATGAEEGLRCPVASRQVPKGHVWLEGDNLRNSTDSRCYGPVPYGLIRGRICFKIWPLNDFGFLRASPNGHRFLDD